MDLPVIKRTLVPSRLFDGEIGWESIDHCNQPCRQLITSHRRQIPKEDGNRAKWENVAQKKPIVATLGKTWRSCKDIVLADFVE
jgi:hypothetical protein